MKTIKLLFCLLLLSSLACSRDNDIDTNDPRGGHDDGKRTIPIERALEELGQMLSAVGDGTRSAAKGGIADVQVVTDLSPTRAAGGADTLLYIVNFTDNGGYALMGATTRNEGVFALTDEGNLSAEEFSARVNDTSEAAQDDLPTSLMRAVNDFSNTYIEEVRRPSFPCEELPSAVVNLSYGPWVIEDKCDALLITKWDQGPPYNTFCPFDGQVHSMAGCVAIALAQIIAYHKMVAGVGPGELCGRYFDWDTIFARMRERPEETPTEEATLEIADLIYGVGLEVKMEYGINKSSASIGNAIDCLESIGYLNPHKEDYNFQRVLTMLRDRHSPTCVVGDGRYTNGDVRGHAWVVDGYRLYRRYTFSMGNYYDTEYKEMVHCNFGWGGHCNGYYVSEIFNLMHGADIPDPNGGDTPRMIENYYKKKMIIYRIFP